MLNPSDVANKRFDKFMGKGYRPEAVDGYLNQLSREVATLIEEKQALEGKLEALADKLMEYRNDEDSLRSALIGAQKLGDTVIRESKEKAALIMEDAKSKASFFLQEAQHSMEREQAAHSRFQQEVSSFKMRLQGMYKQHLELISALPAEEVPTAPMQTMASAAVDPRQRERTYDAPPPPAAPAPTPAPAAPEIEPSRERMYFQERPIRMEDSQEFNPLDYEEEMDSHMQNGVMDETAELPQLDYEEEPPIEKPIGKYESRFGTLKFGSQYNIKRDDDRRKK